MNNISYNLSERQWNRALFNIYRYIALFNVTENKYDQKILKITLLSSLRGITIREK